MRIEHSLPTGFLGRRPIRVLVVGAGGTGSAVLMGLPYLHQAMRVWGHPYGLQVSIMDAVIVSETNCVRQPFSISDIGQNKATVLINRINLFWGTKWSAEPTGSTSGIMRRADNTSWGNRSTHGIDAPPSGCARSVSCIPRSLTRRPVKTPCRAVLPSKPSIGKSPSSTRPWHRAHWPCWRGSSAMES